MFSFSEFIKLNKKIVILLKNDSLYISKDKEIIAIPLIEGISFSISNSNFLKLTFGISRLKKRELNSLYSALFTIKKKIENVYFGFLFFYSVQIFLNGVGYKAMKVGLEILSLKVGNSHNILISIPQEIDLFCFKENLLVLRSFSKELLGNFVSRLVRCQFPDAYEFKGLIVQNMSLFRKKKKKK